MNQAKALQTPNISKLFLPFNQADLASIHSEEENDFVTRLTGGNFCWLGGLRYEACTGCTSCQNCGFLWSDGTPRDFNKWCSRQPDNYKGDNYKGEDCMSLNAGKKVGKWGKGEWNDVPCDRTDLGRFVCKKSMN